MNSFTFLSRSSPEKTGYVVDSATSFERCHGVCRWAKFFDTYGDGAVQHSAEVPFSIDLLEDFLGSLAGELAAADATKRDEMLSIVSKHWPRQQNSADKIRFALSLKAKEKTFYYNLDEHKTSTAESKRHDKRWEKVTEFDTHRDGTVKSAAGVLRTGDCYDRLSTLAAWLEIVAVAESTLDVFVEFGMAKERGLRANMADCAWSAIAGYVAAYRSMQDAKRQAESSRQRSARRRDG